MGKKKLLYLGYIGFDNLGDQVCYDAFLQWIKPLSTVFDVTCYDLRNRKTISEINRETPLFGVMVGGGSLFQGTAFVEPILEAANMKLPIWTFGTGIDYFTEDYVQRLMNTAQLAGPPQMFDGKELKENDLRVILQKCRTVGVRGPLTQRFFSHLIGKDKVKIIGDPGLIYTPNTDNAIAEDHPSLGTRFIALNWGTSFNSIFGYNELHTMMDVVNGIRSLIISGYKVFIYPMWHGDMESCKRIYHTIGHPGACELADKVYPIDAICTMLERASMGIGFKLHANVMAARMGTPFISLAYRSKCYDFAKSVGMHSFCISTASRHIGRFIANIEIGLRQTRQSIQKKLLAWCDRYKKQYDILLNSVKADSFES